MSRCRTRWLGVALEVDACWRFEPRYALLLRSPSVYETQGALNTFRGLGCLFANLGRIFLSRLSGIDAVLGS